MQYTQLSRRSALVKSSDIDWEKQYLTFIPIDDCTFTFSQRGTGPLYYSINSGTTWTSGTSVSVSSGIKVMWKGSMTPNRSSSTSGYTGTGIGTFSATGPFKVRGNIMSLLYDDDFIGKVTLAGNWWFTSLFENSTIASASKLSLPAMTLAPYCYYRMFSGCTSLTTAPKLPAMTLADGCYYIMFDGCTSLTTAPELPAMTLVNSCYYRMFSGCTSLTDAPALPAMTLADSCYERMFYGCTSLITAPELPATTLANRCYYYMFYNCSNLNYIKCLATDISATNCTISWLLYVASTGTFVKAAGMEDWPTDASGIPSGWTVVDDNS